MPYRGCNWGHSFSEAPRQDEIIQRLKQILKLDGAMMTLQALLSSYFQIIGTMSYCVDYTSIMSGY